jgi:rare lipoprotein A
MANRAARPPRQALRWAAPRALALAATLVACLHASENTPARSEAPAPAFEGSFERQAPAPRGEVQVGFATWYGAAFAGRRTASGEPFDPLRLTAAHRTLPFGTWVEVTRVDTGASVRVRITDRGPFGHADRIIDLSRGAAEYLDLVKAGTCRVELRVVDGP